MNFQKFLSFMVVFASSLAFGEKIDCFSTNHLYLNQQAIFEAGYKIERFKPEITRKILDSYNHTYEGCSYPATNLAAAYSPYGPGKIFYMCGDNVVAEHYVDRVLLRDALDGKIAVRSAAPREDENCRAFFEQRINDQIRLEEEVYDNSFKCPDLSKTPEDQKKENGDFLLWYRKNHQQNSIEKIAEFRDKLFKNHNCIASNNPVHTEEYQQSTPSLKINIPIQTSFDCSKAYFPDEKTICRSLDLSSLDRQLAQFYFKAKAATKNSKSFRAEQNSAIIDRRECGTDEQCIVRWYAQRKQRLQEILAQPK